VSSICVAICTHDRHADLARLVEHLAPQLRAASARLVVVDNGRHPAADSLANLGKGIDCSYHRLAEPGLVAARNAALRHSLETAPEFIAFMDDDEVPDPGWLQALAANLQSSGADICCGPLRPRFDAPAPRWAVDGGFFAKTGRHIGTGNIMFRSAILPQDEAAWFQPAFAHTGGEDEELFSRLMAQGARFTTAADAWVTERVPASRLSLGYIVRTGLRDGVIAVALASSRRHSRPMVAALALRHMATKAAYAAFHLLKALQDGWHLVAALRDAAEVMGTLAALFGWRIRHYGRPA
jgi:succinoglycan biosynthesis protein ExoM